MERINLRLVKITPDGAKEAVGAFVVIALVDLQ
jgi:hypothetical protein